MPRHHRLITAAEDVHLLRRPEPVELVVDPREFHFVGRELHRVRRCQGDEQSALVARVVDQQLLLFHPRRTERSTRVRVTNRRRKTDLLPK